MFEEGEGEERVGSYVIFLAEGETLAKQGEYSKAIGSFTKALEFEPDDKACLVARSKCYLQQGDASNALKDAEASLKDDSKYHRGLYHKAEALYQMGDFEYALMFYHRGNKIRPDLQEFRLGIHKAQEAINNSIGTPQHCKLEKIGDMSHFQQKDAVVLKGRKRRGDAQSQAKGSRIGPVASEKTTKQLLGLLYADRDYLQGILSDPGLTIDSNDKAIYKLAQEGINYLDSRTEFWRQQKPMYARKREKELKKWNKPPTRPQAPFRRIRSGNLRGSNNHTKYVLKSLEDIDRALASGEAEKSLAQAEALLKTVEDLSEQDLPNKEEFVASLHSCLGSAHLELGNQELALQHHSTDLELAQLHEIPNARARALYNLGRVHSFMGEYDKALEYWMQRVPLLKSSEESAWLFHEIARAKWELCQYSEALEYGNKSLDAARDAGDQSWQLCASMLIAQAEVKLDDISQAIQSFKCSLDLAKLLDDKMSEEAIKKALEDCNSRIVESLQQQHQPNEDEGKSEDKVAEGGERKEDA